MENYQIDKLKSFKSPKENKSRIAKDLDGMLEFDLVKEVDDEFIEGHLRKRFIMLDKSFFNDYLKQRNSKDCFYRSFIDDGMSDEHIPQNFPVLIKEHMIDNNYYLECFVSRLANQMGIETSYNIICIDNKRKKFLASLDFVRPNERIVTFDEICKFLNKDRELFLTKDIIGAILDYFIEFCRIDNIKVDAESLYGITANLVKSYFFRVGLLGDIDYNKNVAFLFNLETKKVRLAPSFDYECCFNSMMKELLAERIKLYGEKYPEIIDEMMTNFQKLLKRNKFGKTPLKHLINKELYTNDEFKSEEEGYINFIIARSKYIFDIYDKIRASRNIKQ